VVGWCAHTQIRQTTTRERLKYKGHALKWDTVIEQKTVEFGRYLVGRTGKLSFSEPSPTLRRLDSLELRSRILGLSQSEAKKLGIGKSTFHYLRNKAAGDHPFKVYNKIGDRLITRELHEQRSR
jgi:hypothetical protein